MGISFLLSLIGRLCIATEGLIQLSQMLVAISYLFSEPLFCGTFDLNVKIRQSCALASD